MFFVSITIFALSTLTASGVMPDGESGRGVTAVNDRTENRLPEEEVSCLTRQAEEPGDIDDKMDRTIKEKRELRKEVKTTQVRTSGRFGGYVFVGIGILILVISIIILV